MITSMIFTTDWRCFAEGERFHFYPGVNLLVGDQACGKSSLLAEIRNCGSKLKHGDRARREKRAATLTFEGGETQSLAFDFEKDNFRTKGYFDGNTGFHVASMFSSHGEGNKLLLKTLDKVENSVLFLDEPDMALSIRSAHAMAQLFERVAGRGNQILAAVHNPVVIQHFEQVLSLEHRRWLPSKDFIAWQYEPKLDTFPRNLDHDKRAAKKAVEAAEKGVEAAKKKAKKKGKVSGTMTGDEAADFLSNL